MHGVKLSPTQLRVLRYASEGRLCCGLSGVMFVYGEHGAAAVTSKGAALLEEQEGA